MKNVLISTGGTGGHVIPALNINDHLSNIFNTYIVTDLRGIKFIDKNKYKFEVIETPKFPSSLTKYPIYFFLIIYSLVKSLLYLKKKKIHYLISTGGYMSIPLCISAKILGINIYLFEPNKVLGKSNKLILRFCKKIICNYENIINFPSKFDDKIFLIKPILKKEIFLINKNKKTPNNGLNILVLGGSQGANFFDQFVENPFGQFYSEFCSACGRGPAIDDNEPCNNGKNKYNGSHGLFDKIIDVAKKDNFKSYQIWQDSVNYWTINMPEAFGKKNYREGGTTGIRSNAKYITDYIRR